MVTLSNLAKNDLKEIHDYIIRDSKFYANKVIDEILTKLDKLNAYPQMGRVVSEINDPRIREIFAYSYRIIYQLTGENIEILAVVHSKRDFPNSE